MKAVRGDCLVPAEPRVPVVPLDVHEWAQRQRQREQEEEEKIRRIWGPDYKNVHSWKVPVDPSRPDNLIQMGDLFITGK